MQKAHHKWWAFLKEGNRVSRGCTVQILGATDRMGPCAAQVPRPVRQEADLGAHRSALAQRRAGKPARRKPGNDYERLIN